MLIHSDALSLASILKPTHDCNADDALERNLNLTPLKTFASWPITTHSYCLHVILSARHQRRHP